jgi:hypothetical protein
MNVTYKVLDAKIAPISFLLTPEKHKGIISCRRYQIQGKKEKKNEKICPVSLKKFARSLARFFKRPKEKKKRMFECSKKTKIAES